MAINRVDVTVTDLAALTQLHVATLEDGCLTWVTSKNAYYVLQKASGQTPDGVTILEPLPGSPIAGADSARWILDDIDIVSAPGMLSFRSTADLAAIPGPIASIDAWVDETNQAYRWIPGDTTPVDGWRVIANTGGVNGRWILIGSRISLASRGGGLDDTPRLLGPNGAAPAMANKGRILFRVGTWTFATSVQMPSGSFFEMEGPGVDINATMGPGAFDHFIFWKFISIGVGSTLASTPTIGSNTISVVSAAPFSVGQWIWVGQTSGAGLHNFLVSQYQITNIVGTTLTLERAVLFPFSATDPVRPILSQVRDITLIGNGATVRGVADRAFELEGAYRCHIERFKFIKTGLGTFGNVLSLDIGSLDSSLLGLEANCPGTSDAFMMESAENCTATNMVANNCGNGVTMFDCQGCVVAKPSVSGSNNTGVRLVSNLMTVGCYNCTVLDAEISNSANVGIALEYGSDNEISVASVDTAAVGYDTGQFSVRPRFVGIKSARCTVYGIEQRAPGASFLGYTSVDDLYGLAAFAACDVYAPQVINYKNFGLFVDSSIPAKSQINIFGGKFSSNVGVLGTSNRVYGPAVVTFDGTELENAALDASQAAIILIAGSGAVCVLRGCRGAQSSASNGLVIQAGTTGRVEGRNDLDAFSGPVINAGEFSQGTVQLNGATPVNVPFADIKSTDRVHLELKTLAGTGTGLAPSVSYTPGTGFAVTGPAVGDTSTWEWSVVS